MSEAMDTSTKELPRIGNEKDENTVNRKLERRDTPRINNTSAIIEDDAETFEDAAPLHLRSLRSPARLRGTIAAANMSNSNIEGASQTQAIPPIYTNNSGHFRSISRSSSLTRSRSHSPNLFVSRSFDAISNLAVVSTSDDKRLLSSQSFSERSLSSCSSMESGSYSHSNSYACNSGAHHTVKIIDADMLTDQRGFRETYCPPSPVPEIKGGGNSGGSLPMVCERKDQPTLDDVHAFSNLNETQARSRSGSIDKRTLSMVCEGISDNSLEDSLAFSDVAHRRGSNAETGKKQALSLPILMERLSEEKFDDNLAFRDGLSNQMMKRSTSRDEDCDRRLDAVCERLSKEALDDNLAFSNLPPRRASSELSNLSLRALGSFSGGGRDSFGARDSFCAGSVCSNNSVILDTLEEFNDEEWEEEFDTTTNKGMVGISLGVVAEVAETEDIHATAKQPVVVEEDKIGQWGRHVLEMLNSVDANDGSEGDAHAKFRTLNLGTMEKGDRIQLAKMILQFEDS
eukprot:CAMPEP_0194373950 /NCGR_PEP_ID=MMETSP0174-20130528/22321_1 /TAXON_ID=216777 /ORGANISM="Proboscia alata, Strain PI-D3" /LENGTH=513 /DNA_ID=CAMNT_0039153237 /DNA_START=399 /DNA_END=1940 /DNA_ORIENTATION=+